MHGATEARGWGEVGISEPCCCFGVPCDPVTFRKPFSCWTLLPLVEVCQSHQATGAHILRYETLQFPIILLNSKPGWAGGSAAPWMPEFINSPAELEDGTQIFSHQANPALPPWP